MIILASQSQMRRKLLEAAAIQFEARPSPLDEEVAKRKLGAVGAITLAAALATLKAKALSALNPLAFVIGADQTLTLEGETLHKPQTLHDAKHQLWRMRGKTHELHSAVVVTQANRVLFQHVETASLRMRPFSAAFFHDYLQASGDRILLSLGSYQIEGRGLMLFERIEGDYFSILGLPMLPLLAFLRETGELTS